MAGASARFFEKGLNMRFFVLPARCAVWALSACTQDTRVAQYPVAAPVMAASFSDRTIVVGCATCIYGMSGIQGCTLAASIDGEPMLMTGVDVDLHAHALCSVAREAVVTGTMEGDGLVASTIDLE